jgi:GH15 family glucan-1,4-alpha-glucosidase
VVTLWLTQYKIAIANSFSDLEEAAKDIEWAAKYASGSMLSEQLNPYTGEPISATPLTWSHSEFARTVIEYSNKAALFAASKGK